MSPMTVIPGTNTGVRHESEQMIQINNMFNSISMSLSTVSVHPHVPVYTFHGSNRNSDISNMKY